MPTRQQRMTLILLLLSCCFLTAQSRLAFGLKSGLPLSGGVTGEYRITSHTIQTITFNPEVLFVKTSSFNIAFADPPRQPEMDMSMWNLGCKFRVYMSGKASGIFVNGGYVLSYNSISFDKESVEYTNKTIIQHLGSAGVGYRFGMEKLYTEIFADKLFGKDVGAEFGAKNDTNDFYRWHLGIGIGILL